MENSHGRVNGNSSFTRAIADSHKKENGNELAENGNVIKRHSYQPVVKVSSSSSSSLYWLDLRVFYVRVSKCEIDDSTPDSLTLNHIPLNHDTLLEVNSARTNGASTLLRRDRFDKKSEEVTYVSTDSIRTTGSVKFEVFNKDILAISGVLESSYSNGSRGELRNHGPSWSMNCEPDLVGGTGLLNCKRYMGLDLPEIEVYVAGCFSGNPIILTKTLQLGSRRNQMRILKSIPDFELNESQKDVPNGLNLQVAEYSSQKPGNDEYNHEIYRGMEYLEGEDGELSWFTAGVRVGVGIGLSVCLGVGVGVGLVVRAYQGATRNLRR